MTGVLSGYPPPFAPVVAGAGGAAHLVLLGDLGYALLDQPGLGRGAAHVEGQEIGPAELGAQIAGGDDPGGGTGLDHEHGPFRPRREGVDAAAALHEEEGGGHALLPQARLDALQVASHHGPDAGVDYGGAGAEVLAEVRGDLGGKGNGVGGEDLPQDLPHSLLVRRVEVGMEEADGYRLHPLRLQLAGDPAHCGLVQRLHHPAAPVEALGNAAAPVARNQGGRLAEVDVVEGGADLALDLQHVAEPGGGDEAGGCELALDDGVGGHGGGVHHVAQAGGVHPGLGEDAGGGAQEASGGIVGGGRDLGDAHLAAGLVDQYGVGECPADVDPQAVGPPCARRGAQTVNPPPPPSSAPALPLGRRFPRPRRPAPPRSAAGRSPPRPRSRTPGPPPPGRPSAPAPG